MGTVTGQRVVDVARTFLGTRFVHMGREKRVGVDCVGLPILVARELKVTDYEPENYSRMVDPARLKREFEQFCFALPPDAPLKSGDILLFTVSGVPQHVGIYSAVEGTMIHAWESAGEVCEHDFDRFWRKQHVATFRLRGLEE